MNDSKPTGQLSLQLPLEAAQTREDWVVTDANVMAVAFLDLWPEWPGPLAVLTGPEGAGKTHLCHAWAERAKAQFLSAPKAGDTSTYVPEHGNFVVEDLAQGSFSQTWLFHLINAVRASGGALLLTSRDWPGNWGMTLPDLKSRMKLAHLMELDEPDEALLTGVLIKLFADRQLNVEPSVIHFIVMRMERSLGFAQKLVNEIDRLSLMEKRGVTKPLVSLVFKELGL